MTVLFLATVAFGLTFHLQMPSGAAVDKNLVAQSLWDSMLMATLGDNGGLAVQEIVLLAVWRQLTTLGTNCTNCDL